MKPADPFTCIQCGDVLPEGAATQTCEECQQEFAQEVADQSAPQDDEDAE